MATANWFDVSKETTNYGRICKLVIDGGTRVLRDVFDNFHKPQPLHIFLKDPKNHATLQKLKKTKILTGPQWNKLYPTGPTKVDSSGFDITLLCALLRNLCNLPTPIGGWNNPPAPTSINTEDDLVRIRLWRNERIAHTPKAALSDTEFKSYWSDIKAVLVRLGGAKYQPDIDNLEGISMDPEDVKYYIQYFEEWDKSDEKIIKALEATEERLMHKMDEVTEKMDSTKKELAEKIDHQAERIDEVHRKLGEFESTLQASSRATVPDTSFQVTEKTDYQYGCYCGLGGRGKPFDATDRCCQVHDQCYTRIQRGICNYYDPYYKSYVHWGLRCQITHTGWWWWWRRRRSCTSEICLCDVEAVEYFRRNLPSFNNRLRNYNKNRC